VAKFYIDRYLKYAHLAEAPELEVLGDTFELPLALSAAPLGVVCETDWKGLNAVIAGFSHGKKVDIGVRLLIAGPSLDSDPIRAQVEIEFLQLRVHVEGRGKLTISHMLKITELSEEAEAKLIEEFPTPEVMELKPGTHKVALEVSKKNSKKRGAPEPSDGHAHEHAAHAAAAAA